MSGPNRRVGSAVLAALGSMTGVQLGAALSKLEPGIGALPGFLILGQALAAAGVVAITMIVAASVGVTLSAARAEAPIPLAVD